MTIMDEALRPVRNTIDVPTELFVGGPGAPPSVGAGSMFSTRHRVPRSPRSLMPTSTTP